MAFVKQALVIAVIYLMLALPVVYASEFRAAFSESMLPPEIPFFDSSETDSNKTESTASLGIYSTDFDSDAVNWIHPTDSDFVAITGTTDYSVEWVDENSYVLSWQVGATTNIIATALAIPSDAVYKSSQANCEAWYAPQESYNRANNQASYSNYGNIFCTRTSSGSWHCLQNTSFPDNLCIWPIVNMSDSCEFKQQRNSQCGTICTQSQCNGFDGYGPWQTLCPTISSLSRYNRRLYYDFSCGPIQCYASSTTTDEQYLDTCIGECSYGNCSGGSCSDECSSGQTRCDGSYKQTCGNYDSDSCLEWGNDVYCSSGCSNGNCNQCTPHSNFSCYDNDVYWFDSCNNREEKKEECGTLNCANGACIASCSPDECDLQDYYEDWEFYCSGNERWKHRKFYDYHCFGGACEFFSDYYTDETLIEVCSFCNQETAACFEGCSGQIVVSVMDLWSNPMQGAKVYLGSSLEGTTAADGKLSIPTASYSCGETYTIKTETPSGRICGEKTTIIDTDNDNDFMHFSCETPKQKLELSVSGYNQSYSGGETITFNIEARNESGQPAQNANIGIYDPFKLHNVILIAADGTLTYETTAERPGTKRFYFSAAKQGYEPAYIEALVNVTGAIGWDTDSDGLPDIIEILLGLDPNDSGSNLVDSVGGQLDFSQKCSSFLPFGVFSIEQKEELLAAISSQSIDSVQAFKSSSIMAKSQGVKQISFLEAVEKSDELLVFEKSDGTIIVLTDAQTDQVIIYIMPAACEGFYKGIAYGVLQGVTDDIALVSGIAYFALNSEELSNQFRDIQPMVTSIFSKYIGYYMLCNNSVMLFLFPYCRQAQEEISSGFAQFVLESINQITLKADEANTKYRANDLERLEFIGGFTTGYITGYWAEQIGVSAGAAQLGKTGIKTVGKLLSRFAAGTLRAMKATATGRRFLSAGGKIARGATRTMEWFDNAAQKFDDFWAGIKSQYSTAPWLDDLGTKMDDAFGTTKTKEIMGTVLDSKAGKTMLQKEVKEGLPGLAELKLKGITGADELADRIKNTAKDPGRLKGALFEAEGAAQPKYLDQVAEVGKIVKKADGSTMAEIDALLKNGDVLEMKNWDWIKWSTSDAKQELGKQITNLRNYNQTNKITFVFKNSVPSEIESYLLAFNNVFVEVI